MLNFRLGLSGAEHRALEGELAGTRQRGDLPRTQRVLSTLALADGMTISAIAGMLRVSPETVRGWVNRYLVGGARGLRMKKSPGRRPKLTKSQRRELCQLIEMRVDIADAVVGVDAEPVEEPGMSGKNVQNQGRTI